MPDATFRRRLRVPFAAALVAAVGLAGIVAGTSTAFAAVDPNTAVRVNQVAYPPGVARQLGGGESGAVAVAVAAHA